MTDVVEHVVGMVGAGVKDDVGRENEAVDESEEMDQAFGVVGGYIDDHDDDWDCLMCTHDDYDQLIVHWMMGGIDDSSDGANVAVVVEDNAVAVVEDTAVAVVEDTAVAEMSDQEAEWGDNLLLVDTAE